MLLDLSENEATLVMIVAAHTATKLLDPRLTAQMLERTPSWDPEQAAHDAALLRAVSDRICETLSTTLFN